MKEIIVVGAGASGIMAAITAASAGQRVTVLEQNEKPLKKLLMTGNGRCNLTNLSWDADDVLRGRCVEKAHRIIKRFDHRAVIGFFENIGLFTHERDGWVYPMNDSASSVAKILLREAERLKVKIKTNQKVVDISKTADGKFEVVTTDWRYCSDAVIVSTGSSASVESNGFDIIFELAKKFNLSSSPFYPALTSLKFKKADIAKWTGVRVCGKIVLSSDNKVVTEKHGRLQLTQYGISGIPVFELARYAVALLEETRNVSLIVDFLPEISKDELYKAARKIKHNDPQKSDKLIMSGFVNEKLADYLLSCADSLEDALSLLKRFEIRVAGYLRADKAQACMGGINLNDLTEELEAKTCTGLHFTGEAVDIDGTCGGYNLQWAWSSGHAAAKGVIDGADMENAENNTDKNSGKG